MSFWPFGKKLTKQQPDQPDQPTQEAPEPATEPAVEPAAPEQPTPEATPETTPELTPDPIPEPSSDSSWIERLGQGLSRSTGKITSGLVDIFTKSHLTPNDLEQLEELLIMADLGPRTSAKIVSTFGAQKFEDAATPEEITAQLSAHIAQILAPVAKPLAITKPENGPFVILVTGVNGVGKTTTIGKLAHQFIGQGHKVMLAAADTFRAAAIEQIKIWGERLNAPVIAKDIGADAAAVAFEGYTRARAENYDVLIVDTAGRLHNKKDLMDELGKISRVLGKHDTAAPHATLLVLDATTGQNAFAQVESFKEVAKVTGLIVTKLDGSAKGGVVVGLADTFGLPIHAVGVGEQLADLQAFDAHDYANSLLGISA